MKLFHYKKNANLAVLFLALVSIMIHLLVVNNLEYHRDELLYFSLGLHPATGYASVPPLIGWIAWFMENIFGVSVFAVRLFPALLSGIMVLLTASIARELGGSEYASFLSALGLSVSIFFMRSFGLFQPVHIEIFLWTLCIYIIIKYINSSSDKYLIYFGIVAGLALLNKYLAGLLFAGLLLVVPFTDHRTIFRKSKFWIAMGAALVIFLPNLIWQASHGFPVFHHINQLYDTQLVHMSTTLFLSEQLLMPFTGSLFTIAGIIFLLADNRIRKFRFLGLLSLFVISALMILKGKSYYTLGVFPLIIASGAVAYDKWLRNNLTRILFPVLIVLVTLPVVPMGIPVYGKYGLKKYFRKLDEKYGIDTGRRFEDGTIHSLPQDYADMLGWNELTQIAQTAYHMIDDKDASFIYCENYGQAGAVTIIGKKYGLPEAVCFQESFSFWFPQEFDPDITSIVYINSAPGEDVKTLFRKITLVGRISDPDAREFGTGIYLCQDPVYSFNKFWKARTAQE